MFKSARIKLTAWYLVFITLISLAFSMVIYREVNSELERFARIQRVRIERRFLENYYLPPPPEVAALDPELIIETRWRVIVVLGGINAGIILLFGGLSYLLAGWTLAPIQQMLEEQDRFISDASHELRTPLTSLKTALEVFLRQKKPISANAKEVAENSLEQVNRMQKLAENLLTLSRSKNPEQKKYYEKVSADVTLEAAIKKIKPLADKKQIILESKINRGLIKGDRDELEQLWTILLDNAVKYSPNESTIKVAGLEHNGNWVAEVVDEGLGISEKDKEHIFERFFRADRARSRAKDDGFGLGLAIAKQIVTRHEGKIILTSEEGKGSKFTVILPELSG